MLGSSLFLRRNCTCGPRKFDPADILGFCYIVFPTKSVAPLGKSADSTGLKLVIFFSAQHHLSCHRARSRTQSRGAFHVSSSRHGVFIGR